MKIDTRWLAVLLTLGLAAFVACSQRTVATRMEVVPAPQFESDNPESIYAADLNDSWNRIFRALFTRTVKARLSSDFADGAPLVPFRVEMGSFDLRISREKLSRKEIGDRAIEPLYPTFFTAEGPAQVLSEPRFSELTAALGEAIAETKSRSPVERALIQSDVWAAYDIIFPIGHGRKDKDPTFAERKAKLLALLSEFVHKLALSSEQIKSLRNNYRLAVVRQKLPDVFSPDSGWLEIELLPQRSHDRSSDYRRAARVFVKPRTIQSDPGAFVESLKHHQHLEDVEAVALVVQNLLIDASGKIVPSPLFSDVQFRFFTNDSRSATIETYELSRRLLLTEPESGGLVKYDQMAPAYLSEAGNDYTFAGSIQEADAPIVVPLRTRCTQCHGKSLVTLMTYSIHDFPPVPAARVLDRAKQERGLYVARIKESRADFKSLFGVR
ncbi:MAG TPA: hypothetical protein VF074_21960 [Pyrinomonadaceae bacterium]